MDEEVDAELLALQGMFEGANMVPAALVLALLDAGVIDKGRFLDIIESLHGILAADFVGRLGSLDDAEVALNSIRGWLAGSDWQRGRVLEQLHTQEALVFLRSQRMLANSKRKPTRPPDETQ